MDEVVSDVLFRLRAANRKRCAVAGQYYRFQSMLRPARSAATARLERQPGRCTDFLSLYNTEDPDMEKIYTYLLMSVALATIVVAVQHFSGDAPAAVNPALHSTSIQAHDLAVSGVDYALVKLREDPSWGADGAASRTSIPGVRIEAASTTADGLEIPGEQLKNARYVTANSFIEDASAVVQAIIECPTEPGLPQALRFALFSGGDVMVDNQLLVRDESNRLLNANVHSNRGIEIGRRSMIQGFGTYSGLLEAGHGATNEVFSPNYANGGSSLYRHPAIGLPSIDVQKWQDIATRTYASSTILAGDLDIGTAHHPGVWLINGHLDMRDGIKGSGIILVTGDLRLYGKKAHSLLNQAGENLCIIVAGNVFAEAAEISASIICGGSFYGSGRIIVNGSIVSHGDIRSNGTLDIYYRPLPSTLALQVWSPQTQPPRIVRFFDNAKKEQKPSLAMIGLH